jgi:septum formation inhibitor MinC
LKSVIASNSAAVFLQTQNWPKAQEHASTAITADPLNYKAFLRRGKARANLDLCDEGKRDLNQALLLATEKDDKATIREAKAELALMAKKEHDRFRHDQKLFTNLFDRMRSLEEMENKQREAELARQKQLEEEEKKRREAEIARQQEEQKAKDTAMKTDSPSAETTPENASETTMKTDATPAEKAPEQAPQ